MIPNTYAFEELNTEEDSILQPSTTYRIDWENNRIAGIVDGIDAIIQFAQKVFSTDKYAYSIYDWYYGNELFALIGQPQDYVEAQLPQLFDEALLPDDRILSIDNYVFDKISIDSLSVSCTINTIYGSTNFNLEVSV